METSSTNQELFRLVLSQPVAGELSQSVTVGVECMFDEGRSEGIVGPLETINEKSFKEMLYGPKKNKNV